MVWTEVVQVYVGVGSNIRRRYHLHTGVRALRHFFGPLQVSRVYESRAVGFAGPPFWNLVCGFTTTLRPRSLIRMLHFLELRHGRRRIAGGYTSRTLDLDLLLYGARVSRRPTGPVLPHSDLTARAFVLRPLAELAGAFVEPVSGRCIEELWREFKGGPSLSPSSLQLL